MPVSNTVDIMQERAASTCRVPDTPTVKLIGRMVIPKPIYKTTQRHIPEYRNISNILNGFKSKNYVHQEETRVRLVSESAFCRSVYVIFSTSYLRTL